MTKKLEQILNLAQTTDLNGSDIPDDAKQFIEENQLMLDDVNSAIDRIDAALPTVRDLETGDDELDELAKLAKDKFEDMVDLGMAVEPRFSGVILQTASTLLGHAITAKTAKLDKKLRMVQLQLAKAKLDYQIEKDAKNTNPADEAVDGQGIVLDRNELLKSILNKSTK
jgi:hypothetical protein